jgi:hypothetical protein
MADYYTLLTNAGIAYETACKAAGTPIKLTQISVGDGGEGGVYNPAATATALKREVWRGPLNALFQDEKNPSWLLAEVTIPPDVGGWYVREAGLWTDTGILYAIVKYPESFKPVLATSGSGKEFYIRSIFETSNASLVTLLIDDTVVKATRAWVAGYVADELAKLDKKQSVRVATKANIVLSGAQMIDAVAVISGDRVLVKNQTQAKDNGIYIAANGAWIRAKDADTSAKVTPNLEVTVEAGATLADTIWQLITDGPIVLDTTPLTFQDVTAGFARLMSPVFEGVPTCPTPAQFDGSQLLVNAEFVRRHGLQYSSFKSVGNSYVVTLADIGGLVSLSNAGPITCTLPPTSSVPATATAIITIVSAGTGAVTISANAGGDTLNTSTGVVGPIVLGLGDTAEFLRLNGQWRLIGGSVVIRYSSVISAPVFTTQPQFDTSKAFATTEFVQRAAGNFSGQTNIVTLPASLVPAMAGRRIVITGPGAVTLPPLVASPVGSKFYILNIGTADVTLNRQGNDTIVALSKTLTSVTVQSNSNLVVTCGDNNYVVEEGASSLKYSNEFSASLSSNGYQQLPSGLIIQWGTTTTTATADLAVLFPMTFPTRLVSLNGTAYIGGGGTRDTNVMLRTDGLGKAGFSAGAFLSGTRVAEAFYWVAIGW